MLGSRLSSFHEIGGGDKFTVKTIKKDSLLEYYIISIDKLKPRQQLLSPNPTLIRNVSYDGDDHIVFTSNFEHGKTKNGYSKTAYQSVYFYSIGKKEDI